MVTGDVRYPCVCCGHLTMDEPPGSHLICPVCFWEDDPVQLRWPDLPGGANRPSLIEAQAKVKAIGACDERLVSVVRPPCDGEQRDPYWRPIDVYNDQFERRGDQEAPWPDDLTALYWWRYRANGSWRSRG